MYGRAGPVLGAHRDEPESAGLYADSLLMNGSHLSAFVLIEQEGA